MEHYVMNTPMHGTLCLRLLGLTHAYRLGLQAMTLARGLKPAEQLLLAQLHQPGASTILRAFLLFCLGLAFPTFVLCERRQRGKKIHVFFKMLLYTAKEVELPICKRALE